MFASCSLVMGVNYVYMWALFGQVMMAWTGTSTAVNYNHLIIQGVLIFFLLKENEVKFLFRNLDCIHTHGSFRLSFFFWQTLA